MKIVKVVYTTKLEFVEQNMLNITTVMNDLHQLKRSGIFYHACLSPDGKTFIHTAFFNSEEDHKLLNELPSFKNFQERLKSSGLEVSPKQEFLTLVGSSVDFFK